MEIKFIFRRLSDMEELTMIDLSNIKTEMYFRCREQEREIERQIIEAEVFAEMKTVKDKDNNPVTKKRK